LRCALPLAFLSRLGELEGTRFQLNLMQSYGDMMGRQYYSQKIEKNENILDFWHKTENILYLATRLWARLTFVC
jgi:hypothetical protein